MKPRTKWTSAMVTKYTTFCSKNTENGKTLHWCFTNFSAGDGDATEKYGSRYSSNKAAYQKYVRPSSTKSKQTMLTPSSVRNGREITLTEIREYERQAAAAGYTFVLG